MNQAAEKAVEIEVIEEILKLYGIDERVTAQNAYIHAIENDGRMKLIFRITLSSGRALVIKLLHESDDINAEAERVESQSRFSEVMRLSCIKTPMRYKSGGKHVVPFTYHALPCIVTVEDWCGEEIKEISTSIAYQIGCLMARMHSFSLAKGCKIGCGTLFSAAYENDVDAFASFCKITNNDKLDQAVVKAIKALRDEKLEYLRSVWDSLPKSAVQGDISINNLVLSDDGLTVFDYNNAGDEVLISDLVMEGLLTAYEMDLPSGTSEAYREELFPALLRGYLSVRPLSEAESKAAWVAYTLYHGLWFTRILYNDASLEKLVGRGDYTAANALLKHMLDDMKEADDGRFAGAAASPTDEN